MGGDNAPVRQVWVIRLEPMRDPGIGQAVKAIAPDTAIAYAGRQGERLMKRIDAGVKGRVETTELAQVRGLRP